jgi:hypothetical protein
MILTVALAAFTALQQMPKDALKTALKDTEVQGDWIYDDLPAGFAEAKKTGKPMLVVFRCVP